MLRNVAETLTFAAVGGLTLGWLGMPAGYLSGSIMAVAAASLAGRPMLIPAPLMRVLMTLIGISLGAVVTPETLHGIATYPVSIAVLIVACTCISLVGTLYLRAVHGWDTVSAYLATAPGGLSQVMAIAIEMNADVRAVAIVQTIRVVIIAVCLPALLGLFGLGGHATRTFGGTFNPAQLDELAILIVVSSAVAYAKVPQAVCNPLVTHFFNGSKCPQFASKPLISGEDDVTLNQRVPGSSPGAPTIISNT